MTASFYIYIYIISHGQVTRKHEILIVKKTKWIMFHWCTSTWLDQGYAKVSFLIFSVYFRPIQKFSLTYVK